MKSSGRTQVCLGPSISRNPQPPFFQGATADAAPLDSRMAGRRGFEGCLCGRRSDLPGCKPVGKGYIPLLDRPKIQCELGRRRIAGRRQSVRATLRLINRACAKRSLGSCVRPCLLHSRPIRSNPCGWQAECLREPSLHVSIRYRTKRGFARASPVSLIGCLACNGLWRPPSAAKRLSHSWEPGWSCGSFPATRGASHSISDRAGSATIMTGHAEGPGRDSLGWTGRLIACSHQGEPPSVPASGQAGHRDHCRQAGRRPEAGHLGQHHEAGRA